MRMPVLTLSLSLVSGAMAPAAWSAEAKVEEARVNLVKNASLEDALARVDAGITSTPSFRDLPPIGTPSASPRVHSRPRWSSPAGRASEA